MTIGNIKNPTELVAKGEKPLLDDIKSHFTPGTFAYVLLRVVDVIDGHPTSKFVFINWIGCDTTMMNKAKVATYKGFIQQAFSPFHVDFSVSELREISDEKIMDKVAAASGSKSFVK